MGSLPTVSPEIAEFGDANRTAIDRCGQSRAACNAIVTDLSGAWVAVYHGDGSGRVVAVSDRVGHDSPLDPSDLVARLLSWGGTAPDADAGSVEVRTPSGSIRVYFDVCGDRPGWATTFTPDRTGEPRPRRLAL